MIAPEDLVAIAAAVARELDRRQLVHRAEYLTVDQVAVRLNVQPDYVYRHAVELGGVRLPGGQHGQGRWRFPPERLPGAAATTEDQPSRHSTPTRQTRLRRPARPNTEAELLPIRGSAGESIIRQVK